jgi:hypothetical protein
MSFVDGYGIKDKFTSNTGKKAAQRNKIRESTRRQKAETFRSDEKKSLTKSIGTAGPKVRPDGTTKDDKPTAAQKIAFREQEETYLTKSPGTVGDKYYKNPEGTGTGQGGSGIPKATTTAPVKTFTAPVITPPSYTPAPTVINDNTTYVENTDDTVNPFSLEEAEPLTPLSSEDFMSSSIYRTGSGDKINLAQQILYKDWNQVNVNLVYDGLSIKGVKVNVKVPLPFNQKTKFTFGG